MNADEQEYSPPLDPGIARAVHILRDAGVETYESCEGGEGHSYLEPTIRFHGGAGEGYRGLGVAITHDLPVSALRRNWSFDEGVLTGPNWELVFYKRLDGKR